MTGTIGETGSGTRGNAIADIVDSQFAYGPPGGRAFTRVRLGYPMLAAAFKKTEGGVQETPTDVTVARKATEHLPAENLPAYDKRDFPLAPADTDPLADIKRALSCTPETGISMITGAQFTGFLRGNFDTHVADGSVRFQAIDQSVEVEDDDGNVTGVVPGLTYLRIGKPDPELTDATGSPLPRSLNRAKDQKAVSGIGFFSDGGVEGWAKKGINLRSNEQITLLAPMFYSTSYGKNIICTYELDQTYADQWKTGDVLDGEVPHRIVKVDAVRNTNLGWYKFAIDRGRQLEFATTNKGSLGIGSKFEVSVGSSFAHSIAAGLETAFAGKVSLSKGFVVELGEGGAIFKHPFGAWTQENEAELTANSKVSLSIAGFDTLPRQAGIKTFTALVYGAVAAQTLALTAYNAVLAGTMDMTLKAGEADDTYELEKRLDAGMYVYEAALSLSAAVTAAGLVLGALQAYLTRTVPKDPTTPSIQVTRKGIFLRCGLNVFQMDSSGIRIFGHMGGVYLGGLSVKHMAPVIAHQPVPPPVVPPLDDD